MSLPALNRNLIQRINIGDSLTRSAVRSPRSTAVVEGDRRLSYREFNSQVNRVANALLHRGLAGPGDAVALASRNSIEFMTTYYACAKIGAVCVPINLGWRADEAIHVLDDSRARVLIVQQDLPESLAQAPIEAHGLETVIVIGDPGSSAAGSVRDTFEDLAGYPDDSEPECLVEDRAPITYLYTSGTTSTPKGVVGSHAGVYLESMTMIIEAGFSRSDKFVAMLPMFHVAQLINQCSPAIMIGAEIHIFESFDAENLLDAIDREGITQVFGLPMMYKSMLAHQRSNARNLASLKRAMYGMAPMPQELLISCMDEFECEFYLLFGQTEMSPSTIFRPENQLTHPGSVGTPVISTQVAIMGSDGALLDHGQTGEIVYRGPYALTEYLGNEIATEEVFRNGWLHSGDIGNFDQDGVLWFTDRIRDIVKTGGENVSSLEVEKALYAAESSITAAAVVGLPHEHWSEAITAFIVISPDADVDPENLRQALRAYIDPYKIPKSICIVSELPRTSTGKLKKNEIRSANLSYYK